MTGAGTRTAAAASDEVVLEARGLGVRLPKGRGIARLWSAGHWAIRDVSFSLRRGETIAIIGHNGSGKSTLLRTLAGILAPDEGEVRLARGLSAAILAPGAGFDGRLTGRENLYNVALYHGYMPRDVARRMDAIIEFSEIGSWVDQPVAVYSAGMRARLGFALSMYLPADILMIDETLSAGDASFREKARDAVQAMLDSEQSVIVVSHNPATLVGMCDTALMLDHGRVCAHGSVESVLAAYEEAAIAAGSSSALSDMSPAPAAGAADEPSQALQAAAAELSRARAARRHTESERVQARDAYWRYLEHYEHRTDAFLAAIEAASPAVRELLGADEQLAQALAQLQQGFREFVVAREKLEHSRAADLESLQRINEARVRYADARKSS